MRKKTPPQPRKRLGLCVICRKSYYVRDPIIPYPLKEGNYLSDNPRFAHAPCYDQVTSRRKRTKPHRS